MIVKVLDVYVQTEKIMWRHLTDVPLSLSNKLYMYLCFVHTVVVPNV